MKHLNLKFVIVLLVAAIVTAVGISSLHGYQLRRHAPALLERARRSEAEGDLEKASEALAQYLNFRREDGPTWTWYARIVDQRTPAGRGREQVYFVHEQALRLNSDDVAL